MKRAAFLETYENYCAKLLKVETCRPHQIPFLNQKPNLNQNN